MARARGANAVAALAFAPSYGAVPVAGFRRIPFSTLNLGEEQGLIPDASSGTGREPIAADDDVVNNDGDITVMVDARNIGVHLKGLLGQPVTTQGVAAAGAITFAANPVANDTMTLAGQAFTFKAAVAAATDIKIGATRAETVRNAVWALNASAVAAVTAASYSTDRDAAAITITHDTIGVAGNAFTLAASAATVSGATLAGGSALGPYNHVYTSGAVGLPDAAIEIGYPDVPAYRVNYGVLWNTLAIQLQRSGLLNATFGLIAQGERDPTTTSAAGTLTEYVAERFSQFAGEIAHAGVPLAEVVSGQVNYNNNFEKAENIRSDGRIDGADPGKLTVTPVLTVRLIDLLLDGIIASKQPVELAYGWRRGPHRLTFRHMAVRLPKARGAIPGPGGIQRTYNAQGQKDPISGKSLIVTLVNDVPSY